jgi:hypothetical protein
VLSPRASCKTTPIRGSIPHHERKINMLQLQSPFGPSGASPAFAWQGVKQETVLTMCILLLERYRRVKRTFAKGSLLLRICRQPEPGQPFWPLVASWERQQMKPMNRNSPGYRSLASGGCSVDQLAITDVFSYLAIQSGTRFEHTLRLFQHEYRGKQEPYWEF